MTIASVSCRRLGGVGDLAVPVQLAQREAERLFEELRAGLLHGALLGAQDQAAPRARAPLRRAPEDGAQEALAAQRGARDARLGRCCIES